jgi:predicted deacylase
MAYRDIPVQGDELKQMLREIGDRLERLETGGAISGQVSFGDAIQIGDVLITILDTGSNGRTVQFENVLTGATDTIVL